MSKFMIFSACWAGCAAALIVWSWQRGGMEAALGTVGRLAACFLIGFAIGRVTRSAIPPPPAA
jgi:uncharacterized membrane protein